MWPEECAPPKRTLLRNNKANPHQKNFTFVKHNYTATK